MSRIRNAAILGGVHGNERTGIVLIEKWRRRPELVARPGIKTELLIGNPLAVKRNVRYLDEDLNRAFHIDRLNGRPDDTWESRRAHELNLRLGPKLSDDPKVDFILDMHTTTSNMGDTLIIYDKPLHLKLAKFLKDRNSGIHIYLSDKPFEETIGLQSLTPHGAILEIGPIPQGVLFHDVFERMERVVSQILDFLVLANNNEIDDIRGPLEAYQRGQLIPYPKNENGEVNAMIHKSIQNRNYVQLKKGDPLFITFDGEVIPYQDEPGYPVFINEAAYYEKDMALRVNKKVVVEV